MAENLPDKLRELEERLERIEKWMGISGLKPTPGFDPVLFQQALNRSLMPLWVCFMLALVACIVVPLLILPHVGPGGVSQSQLFGLPLFAVNGLMRPAVFAVHGIGLVSVGGAGVGVIAFGGLAVGIVAIGGGAIGIISFGGGSLGVIAVGGGAIGYIAIGGGAAGKYVLAERGKGRYVFDPKRQDPEAVELFCRWFPRLRQAFTAEKQTSS
jgi:hypothetical protein